MKTFWRVFAVAAVLLILAGCSGGGGSGGGDYKSVGTVTASYNGKTLTEADGLTININETLTISVSASGASKYSLLPNDRAIVNTTSGLNLIGVSSGTTVVVVQASNASGGANSTKFSVTVPPVLTSFTLNYGASELQASGNLTFGTGKDITLKTHVTPAGAHNAFIFDDDDSGVIQSYTEDTVTLKSDDTGTFNLTVTPVNANYADKAQTFEIEFGVSSLTAVTAIDVYQDSELITGDIALKRGRSVTLTASIPNPAEAWGAEIAWQPVTGVLSMEVSEDGMSATFTAADGDTGGDFTVTVKAENEENSSPATKSVAVKVPHRGDTIFEWYADENPEEGSLASDTVRNYPGFRDVYIQARGSSIPFNTEVSGKERRGMYVGRHSGTVQPRLMIGAAVNVSGGTASAVYVGDDVPATATNAGTINLLHRQVMLTMDFDEYSITSGNWMRLYVNNTASNAGPDNSNIGAASQVQHFNSGGNVRMFDYDCEFDPIDSKKGTFTFLIDYDRSAPPPPVNPPAYPPTSYGGSNISQLTSEQSVHLENAFICLYPQNNEGVWFNITGLKLELITSAGITPNTDAKFGDFPDGHFELPKTITLSGSDYQSIKWYIDGKEITGETSKTYTVDKGSLTEGDYSLSVIVKVNGQLYSKTAKFSVED